MNKTEIESTNRTELNQGSSQPRVLFILGVLWGENGITSHIHTLATELIKRGWKVAFASDLADGVGGAREEAMRAVKRFESAGIQYFHIPFPDKLAPKHVLNALNASLTLNSIVSQFKPDLIHVHSLSICPYVQVIKLLRGIPFVSTCHMEPSTQRANVRLGLLANTLLNAILGDRLIAVSSTLEKVFMDAMHVPKEKIRLICHGVESDNFRPPTPEEHRMAREAFGLTSDSKVVCLVGRLDVKKGHALLIKALSVLRSEGIEVIALFAGKGYGDEAAVIQSQAVQAGVADLTRLLGFTNTLQVLWASDVIVLPSANGSEAFALVIPEAMLCGVVPIRTPAAGAFDQIEDGVNGFITPFDDHKTLAARLKEVFQDDQRKSQMSRAAIESARQKFTVYRMAEDTIAVYEEVRHAN